MLKSGSAVLVALLALPALAAPPVIYGEDNRQEVYEASALNQKLAASAATMIPASKLIPLSEGHYQIEQTTLRQWLEAQFEEEQKSALLSKAAGEAASEGISFCSTERFTEQPNAGVCSGFLIAPDLLVTAGHCVVVPNFCQDFKWVFDFQVDADTKTAGADVKQENIYSCRKVISTALSNNLGLDYGLIQLDRKVTGRDPLTVRSEGQVQNAGSLVVIGSPSGLPLKVAGGATVRTNVHPFYFVANLDTFQGNSGSAVFNAETGVVEGILVRGEEDFEANMSLMCIEAKKCLDSECRGEDVSRMTSIPEIAVKDALMKLAEAGDEKEIGKLLKTSFWVDIYGADGKTALMKAAGGNHKVVAEKLIDRGANVKLQDAEGNSALHAAAPLITKKNDDLMKLLLKKGAELEAKNALGETALLVAAKALNLEAVKALLKNGADKNATDLKNENALFPFARKGDSSAVKELTRLGVDTNVRNADGQTISDFKKPGLFARLKK